MAAPNYTRNGIERSYGGDNLRSGPAPIRRFVFNTIYQIDGKIGFEMSLIVVESIRGRSGSFMILTATVSETFGGQTNSYMLVVGPIAISLARGQLSLRAIRLILTLARLISRSLYFDLRG